MIWLQSVLVTSLGRRFAPPPLLAPLRYSPGAFAALFQSHWTRSNPQKTAVDQPARADGIAENRAVRFSGPTGHRYMPPGNGQTGQAKCALPVADIAGNDTKRHCQLTARLWRLAPTHKPFGPPYGLFQGGIRKTIKPFYKPSPLKFQSVCAATAKAVFGEGSAAHSGMPLPRSRHHEHDRC